jgi:glycolate oxidase iron-sulfur subunit
MIVSLIPGTNELSNMDTKNTHYATQVTDAELDRCVACGLCLPLCPTYQVLRSENASPRGRLALIRGLVQGKLRPDHEVAGHLSLCLQCRRCESVCPAGVQYGKLIDAAKVQLRNAGAARETATIRFLKAILKGRSLSQRLVGRLLSLGSRSGLIGLVRRSGVARLLGLENLVNNIPPSPAPFVTGDFYPATGARQGQVMLFRGCINSMVDGNTLQSAIRVLRRFGFDVRVPPDQTCCGAVLAHDGDADTAHTLAASNIEAFSGKDTPVINVASGCGTFLTEYGQLDHRPEFDEFASRVIDLDTFLTSAQWPESLSIRPLQAKALVQDPCSLRNVLHQQQAVYDLLGRIPNLEVVPLADNDVCCGGAGTYALREPAMANTLRNTKTRHIEQGNADYLVSANVGCANHLAGGLREMENPPEIVHPVVLIDRQLEQEEPRTDISSSNR